VLGADGRKITPHLAQPVWRRLLDATNSVAGRASRRTSHDSVVSDSVAEGLNARMVKGVVMSDLR